MLNTPSSTGDFGSLVRHYNTGRKGVPPEVLDFLWAHLHIENPTVLDVGCGTGLPTRQLHDRGAIVTATDVSRAMIGTAKAHSPHDITYLVAPTSSLPFQSNTFDLVTAFSAFHWFSEPTSTREMRRVLRENGRVFVANKNDSGRFGDDVRAIMERFVAGPVHRKKASYDPRRSLEQMRFRQIRTKRFRSSEFFSIAEAIQYFQSMTAVGSPGTELEFAL